MLKNLLPTIWRRSESPVRTEEHPFFALQREMNQMFEDVTRGLDPAPLSGGRFRTFSPSVDLKEDDRGVRIRAELPGLSEKDVEVSLTHDGLTISGEKREEKEDKSEGSWYRETSYGSFRRLIALPEGLNPDKAEARFKNGVLTVELPWKAEARIQGKRIAVKAA